MIKNRILAPSLLLAAALTSAAGQDQPKPMFTRSSKIEMSLAGAAIAGDAYTTRRFTGMGYTEGNLLARPFVSSNAGAVAYFSASMGGVVLGNRLLRNHPRWRHAFNWSVIGAEAAFTANNARFSPWPTSMCTTAAGIVMAPCRR